MIALLLLSLFPALSAQEDASSFLRWHEATSQNEAPLWRAYKYMKAGAGSDAKRAIQPELSGVNRAEALRLVFDVDAVFPHNRAALLPRVKDWLSNYSQSEPPLAVQSVQRMQDFLLLEEDRSSRISSARSTVLVFPFLASLCFLSFVLLAYRRWA